MVIVLILPMRHFFGLHRYVEDRHLDALAKLLLATGLVLTYFYLCEAFTAGTAATASSGPRSSGG